MAVKAQRLEELEDYREHVKLDWEPATHGIEKQLEESILYEGGDLLRQVVEQIRD